MVVKNNMKINTSNKKTGAFAVRQKKQKTATTSVISTATNPSQRVRAVESSMALSTSSRTSTFKIAPCSSNTSGQLFEIDHRKMLNSKA